MKYVKSNFSLTEDGLYYFDGKNRERIAQTFDVSGSTADGSGLVQFKNPDRKLHSVTVTTKMLRGNPRKLAGQLADGGMFISGTNRARRAFVEFLALMMAPSE